MTTPQQLVLELGPPPPPTFESYFPGRNAAAFNALLWEVVNDNFATTDLATIVSRLSLTTGAFRSNLGGEALSIYNAMVASLGSGGWQTTLTEGWLNTTAQDQVRVIPAPAVGMMLGLSGCLLAARRRR